MNYMLFDHFGGRFHDVKKTVASTQDDLMCWAAAASNVLAWTKWGFPSTQTFTDETSIFQYFQDHWVDSVGFVEKAWEWWLNGLIDPNIDVPGGNFWSNPLYAIKDHYHSEFDRTQALAEIDRFLHSGWGVVLNLASPVGGHYLTCWGYEYDATGYTGLYVTDSDDPLINQIRYYPLSQTGWANYPDWWYFQYFNNTKQFLIADVHALDRFPSKPSAPSQPQNLRIT